MSDELRARVEARRAAGEYPPGLEEEMDAHYQRVAATRAVQVLDDLRRRVAAVPPGGLTLPPGTIADRLVQRSLAPLVHQLNDVLAAVRGALDETIAALESPAGHRHDDLMGHIHALWDTLAAHERVPADAPTALRELARRVELLEEAERDRRFEPDAAPGEPGGPAGLAGVAGVAGVGQGEVADLADRLAASGGPVLDLGAGDGGDGGDGTAAGPVARLQAVDDTSLGGVAAFGLLERLSPRQVVELVAAAAEKLRPGGLLAVEAIDPRVVDAHTGPLWRDPRHQRPVHPDWLASVARDAGFAAVDVAERPDGVRYALLATR
jgi:hypothetical protein